MKTHINDFSKIISKYSIIFALALFAQAIFAATASYAFLDENNSNTTNEAETVGHHLSGDLQIEPSGGGPQGL
jgi:hypothetical protein